MPKRLESAYSVTVDMDDERSVFQGHLRIVRSARRARTLRKRGVEVDCYTNPMGIGCVVRRFWAWFETEASYDARAAERKRRALLRRTNWAEIEARVMALCGRQEYSIEIEPTTPEQRAQRMSPRVTVRFGGMTPDEYFETGVRNMSPDCWPLGYNPEVELE